MIMFLSLLTAILQEVAMAWDALRYASCKPCPALDFVRMHREFRNAVVSVGSCLLKRFREPEGFGLSIWL